MSDSKLKDEVSYLQWSLLKVIIALTVAVFLAALMPRTAAAQTFRDASGRLTGTATTDSYGTRTFRDGSGRLTGTATRDSNGTTTFRDGSGRMIGTTERRR